MSGLCRSDCGKLSRTAMGIFDARSMNGRKQVENRLMLGGWRRAWWLSVALMLGGVPSQGGARAPDAPASPAASGPQARQEAVLKWLAVPRPAGRLRRQQLGLVINDEDSYSVAVGNYYIRQRQLEPHQVLRVRLPVRGMLTPEELEPLRLQIDRRFGAEIQALALAWRQPWAVGCNAITAAVTLGFHAAACLDTCARGQHSPYFNQATALPWSQLGLRPAMLLAAPDEATAREMIERGVVSDGGLGRRFSPPVSAVFQITRDAARNSRVGQFPPPARLAGGLVRVRVEAADEVPAPRPSRETLMLFQTGVPSVSGLSSYRFAPGAVADHLTSWGGVLDGGHGQTLATDWIGAGATASYGTVSEPCNHPEKFPHPQILLQNLLAGSTVLEAYWKSVAWPAQGLFVGEPLAAPFARP